LAADGSADKLHTVHVQAFDTAGIASNVATDTFTLDTQAPTVSFQGPTPNETSATNINVTGTVADNLSGVATLQAEVDSGPFVPVTFDTAGHFQFSTSLALDGTADGLHTLHFRGTDQAGNVSGLTDFSFTLATGACGLLNGLSGVTVLQNGGSTAAQGTVTSQGCQVTLREGDSFDVGMEKTVAIPATPGTLSITYSGLTFDTPDPTAIQDAFEGALVDSSGNSLVQTIGAGHDAFFNVSNGQTPVLAPGVTLNGTTVTVNLGGLAPNSNATLILRLVNNDGAAGTHVTITNLATSSSTTSAPTLATPAVVAAIPQQTIDLSQLSDVTAGSRPVYGVTSFDDKSQVLTARLAIQNTGSFPVDAPLVVAIDHISNPAVMVLNSDGNMSDGAPYYDYSSVVAGGTLKPGDTSGARTLTFYDPQQIPFTYDLVVLGQLNRPPAFTSTPKTEAIPGLAYSYQATAVDPDGDPLTFSLVSGPAGMAVDAKLGLVTWSPQSSDLGTESVAIQVADGRGGTAVQDYTITTTMAPPNRPPVFTSTPVVDASVSTPYTYQATATDPDGDPLTFSLASGPPALSIDPHSGLVTWTPTAAEVGTDDVTLQVSDGQGGTATQTYTVGVQLAPGDHPPRIISTPVTMISSSNALTPATQLFGDIQAFYLSKESQAIFGVGALDGTVIAIENASSAPITNGVLTVHPPGGPEDSFNVGTVPAGKFVLVKPGISDDKGTNHTFFKVTGTLLNESDSGPNGNTTQFEFTGTQGTLTIDSGVFTPAATAGPSNDGTVQNFNFLGGPGDADVSVKDGFGPKVVASLTAAPTSGTTPPPAPPIAVEVGYADNLRRNPFFPTPWNGSPNTIFHGEITSNNEDSGAIRIINTGTTAITVNDVVVTLADGAKYDLWGSNEVPAGQSLILAQTHGQNFDTSDHGSIPFPDTYPDGETLHAARIDITVNGVKLPTFLDTGHVLTTGGSDLAARGANESQNWRPIGTAGISNPGGLILPTLNYEYPVKAIDPDNDPLTYSLTTAPAGLTIDPRSGVISGLPISSGTALQFNGTDNVVTIPDAPSLDPASVTVSTWVNFSTLDTPGAAEPGLQYLVFKKNTRSTNFEGYALYKLRIGGLDRLAFTVSSANGTQATAVSTTVVVPGQFYNVAGTYDGADARLYVNGLLEDGVPATFALNYASTPLVLGSSGQSFDGKLSGTLDDLRIYDTALSAASVAADFNRPIDPNSPGLATYLTFDEGSGTVAHDLTGNHNDGTLTTTGSSTDLPQWVPSGAAIVATSSQVTVRVDDGRGGFDTQSYTINGVVQPPGSIAGTVFNDLNGNGVRDGTMTATPEPGLAGWTVYIDANGNGQLDSGELATTTDASGRYELDNLPPGTYNVAVVGMPGWTQTTPATPEATVALAAGQAVTGTDFGETQLNVSAGQRAPVFTSTPPATAAVGTLYRYNASVRNPDGTTLTFDLPAHPAGMTVDPATGVVVWVPSAAELGPQTVVLRVQDGQGRDVLQSFSVTVSQADSAPVITSTPPAQAVVAIPWQYQARAQDAQGDTITFGLSSGPNGLSINTQTGRVTWTPTADEVGPQTAVITASNPAGQETLQQFTLNVVASAPDIPPTITSTPRTSTRLGRTYVYMVQTTNPSGQPLTYVLGTAPIGMMIDATGMVQWTPTPDQFGPNSVGLTVTDARGGTATQDFTVTVIAQDVNHPPTITSKPPTIATLGQLYHYNVTATDPDGDPVLYNLVSGPAGMSIDASLGALRWTPTAEQLGSQNVVVQAEDSLSATTEQEFTIDVHAVDVPPVIISPPVTTAAVGVPYSYTVIATDPEQVPLMYSLTSAPGGMTIDVTSGAISWTPDAAEVGPQAVTVKVDDSQGGVATQTYEVAVTAIAPNRPPTITSTPALGAAIGRPYTYNVTATS
jgi:hypothetical protein